MEGIYSYSPTFPPGKSPVMRGCGGRYSDTGCGAGGRVSESTWSQKLFRSCSTNLKGNRFVAGLVQLDSGAHLLEVILQGQVRGQGRARVGGRLHQWTASTSSLSFPWRYLTLDTLKKVAIDPIVLILQCLLPFPQSCCWCSWTRQQLHHHRRPQTTRSSGLNPRG